MPTKATIIASNKETVRICPNLSLYKETGSLFGPKNASLWRFIYKQNNANITVSSMTQAF